jgi:hypothetical protein
MVSFDKLNQAPGLNFRGGSVMMRNADALCLQNNMRRALAPGEKNLTRLRTSRLAKELLDACHKHCALMWPKGRTSDKFWSEVMRDVVWTRGLTLAVVEEYALALAEAARRALTPEHYAIVISGDGRVEIDSYPDLTMAAIQFLTDIKMYKKHLDNYGDESVAAYRGIEVTDSGVRSEPLRCIPLGSL